MSKKHNWQLPKLLATYADERGVDVIRFSPFHMRVSYDKAVVDIWTSNKYWVKQTNYGNGIIERGSETGSLPPDLYEFLDELLFAVEINDTSL